MNDRSSVEPTYGFFILNRNGLEYVHELLTPDSEVRMEGEFILYEPHAEAGAFLLPLESS